MSEERWLPVVGYEGLYEVSDKGRVKLVANRRSHKAGKILSPSQSIHKYWRICLTKEGKRRVHSVHRLVAAAFIGKPATDKSNTNHKDGNKGNNNAQNLEWVSPSDNTKHAYRTGLKVSLKGDRHWNSKLTEADILDIRDACGISRRKLAAMYGVTHGAITNVILRKGWKHI